MSILSIKLSIKSDDGAWSLKRTLLLATYNKTLKTILVNSVMFLQKSYSYKNYGQCKWELSANLKGKPEDYGQCKWELSANLKGKHEDYGQSNWE